VAGRHRLDNHGLPFATELRAGRTVAIDSIAEDPRTSSAEARAAFERLSIGALLDVPLVKQGSLVAILFIHVPEPRVWREAEIRFAQEVAERTWSALERARAETALRESEGRFRHLADLVPGFVWFTDESGALHYLNDRFYAYTGLTPETALPDGWVAALHPEDRARTGAVWADALARGVTYEIEVRYLRHDGEARWYIVRAEPVRDRTGQTTGWFGTSTDIHDRKLAEAAVAESEARFRNMADNAPVMVWTTDPTGFCTYPGSPPRRRFRSRWRCMSCAPTP
jgi:PAS domain S-box-containing protein